MLNEILSRILDGIMEIVPWAVVSPDECGLRIRLGKIHASLWGGFHFKIPLADSIRKTKASEQTVDLPNQTITTLDGQVVTASGYICYRVIDPEKALLKMLDYETQLTRATMKEIASVVSSGGIRPQPTVEAAIEEFLEAYTDEYGIDVIVFGLTDYAITPAFRLIQ